MVWRVPSIRYLDFAKVKDAERKKATELFGTKDEPTPLAKKIASVKSREADNPDAFSTAAAASDGIDRTGQTSFTPDQRKQLEEMIRNAKTLTEMTRLEAALKEGRMPSSLLNRR